MVEWLRIHTAVQGTLVQSLVQEDPTGRGAAETTVPQSLCSRARQPQPLSPCAATTEAHAPRACARQQETHRNEKSMHHMKSSPHSLQLKRARVQQKRPITAKTHI